MSELKYSLLGKALKAGKQERCYILYGSEKYLVEHYRKEIRHSVMGDADDLFNYHRYQGSETDTDSLRDAVDAYPAFAEHSLVEVRDFDIFSNTDTAAKKLAELLSDLPDYCCLVFIYDNLEYKPDKRKKALYEAVQKYAAEVECPLQGAGELIRWIQNRLKKDNKQISNANAEYLLFLAGNQMDNLANELSKLSLFADGEEVTRSDIEKVVVPVVEAEIFKLTDELSAGRYEAAAELMHKLLELNTEPIYLNAVIGSQLRKLFAARAVKEKKGSAVQLKELINATSDYMPKQYLRICGNFSLDWYRRALEACAKADHRFKSVSDPPEDILWTLFLKLAVK